MRILLPLCFIFMLPLLIGCTVCSKKQVPCEAFTEPAFSKWFPYRTNDRPVFRNLTTDSIYSFTILSIDTSGAYEATTGGYNNTTRSCQSSADISSVNNGGGEYTNIYYSVSKEFDNGPVSKNLSVYFYGVYWNGGEITETGISAANYSATADKVEAATNVLFDNGINYPFVVTIEKDTIGNKLSQPYKLFVAKGAGIIGFETFPARQKWIIQ